MVVLKRRYNERSGRAGGWNREVKRAQGGAVWGWVTDREVSKIREKKRGFNRGLNVIGDKNGQSERVTCQTIRKKKLEKVWNKIFGKFDPKIPFWNGLLGGTL